MPKVTVQVTNPNDMWLKVETTMKLAEWREIVKMTECSGPERKLPYYSPLARFMEAIDRAIRAIEDREAVEYQQKGTPDGN